MLLKFEIKRMFRGMDWIGLIIGMIVMIIAAVINSVVVQPLFDDNPNITYDFYCAICQLMPFVLSPSLGNYFNKDYEEHSNLYYRNVGVPLLSYYINRILVAILTGSIIVACGSTIYFVTENIGMIDSLLVTLILVMQYIYVVLIIALLSYFIRKRIIVIISTILGTMLISLINVLPLKLLKGNLFLLDANSKITENMFEFTVNKVWFAFIENVFVIMIWIFSLSICYFFIIKRQRKR